MSVKMKFLQVMKSCSYVQKLGENTFHKYKYATAADVFEKVNAALVEQGIVSLAKPVILATEQVTTSKGNIETRVTIEMTVTLTDTVTGETLTLTAYGSGQDTGDKAIMKAQTAALKYCYMMSLNISTGDDPEADVGVDTRSAAKTQSDGASLATPSSAQGVPSELKATNNKAVTPEQLKIIFVLARKAGISDDTMRERIYSEYSVTSSRQLTKEQASALIDTLKVEAAALGNIAPAQAAG